MYKLSNAEYDYFVLLEQKRNEIEQQLKEMETQINSYIVDAVLNKAPETAKLSLKYRIDFAKKAIVEVSENDSSN